MCDRVYIAIDPQDAKWNWLLKYHDCTSTETEIIEQLVSIFRHYELRLERAKILMGKVISLPDNEQAPDHIKAMIYEFLTQEIWHENVLHRKVDL